jgi:hypothetical protein
MCSHCEVEKQTGESCLLLYSVHCTDCVLCDECKAQRTKASVCTSCKKCSDCCTCVEVKCGCMVPSLDNEKEYPTSGTVCSTCDECTDCCTCWECPGCRDNQLEDAWKCSNCEKCEDCCTCVECAHCGKRFYRDDNDLCSNCNRCSSCCSCYTCDSCGERVDSSDFCGSCYCCHECCNCSNDDDSSDGPEYSPGKLVFHTDKKAIVNRSKRYISVEIETSKIDYDREYLLKAAKKWAATVGSDGSIHGPEIPTAPANGDLFIKQISELCDALDKDNAEVDPSCGLHCHIDARDFTWYDIRRAILLYDRIEDSLYSIVSQSRRNNQYCAKCRRQYVQALECNKLPKDSKAKIINNVWGADPAKVRDMKKTKWGDGHARYHGLNLQSWLFRGTIEFRMHQGTINKDKIANWGMLLAAIIDYAYSAREKDIKALDYGLDTLKHVVRTSVKNKKTADRMLAWMDERIAKFA